MAITQALLAEEVLSRQERAVVRGVYRASCLADTLASLEKSFSAVQSCGSANKSGDSSATEQQYKVLKAYLVAATMNALVSTKAPASAKVVKDILSPT